MSAHLTQTVVAAGQVFVKGTARSKETRAVPDGAWWSDYGQKPEPKPVDPSKEPARSGPGSGVAAWRAYAETLGITVADDASRDDIIAAVDERQQD